ncbi:hypothetical protein [Niabella hibiscisoli]|uniref:hypothetical protein n=1 Tax=Niabella hibiscisoli TaxID=1825928 RepID=UPI001F0D5E8E|nr:hypothetical protein [Niabella hibiscisoli]MCH5719202.1 hypothetical protein [Niabella hibiscisoli]
MQVSSFSGSENGTLTLTYGKSNSYNDRIDTLTFVCGNLLRNVYIKQSGVTDILSIKGRIGNRMTEKADSVILQFSGPIRSVQVASSWIYCINQIAPGPQKADNTVSFAYNCADLGGDYPFTVRFQDISGTWHTKDIVVPFYKFKLEVAGAITDFVLINNEREAMIASIDPARLTHYAIREDSVIKVYDLSGRIGPKRLAYDRYRSKIYIMGNRPDNVQVDADFTEPLQILDLSTQTITKGFDIPFDSTDHPQHRINVPYDLAITQSGKAVVFLKSPVISTLKWKIVDINDNHRVYLYPLPMTSPELHIYNSYIFTSNPYKITFVPAYGGGYYTTLNLQTYKLDLQLSRVKDRSRTLVFNPVTGATYYDQLYTQFIVSADGKQSVTSGLGILSSRFADFSYVPGDSNRIYYNYEKWLELMDYNTASSPFAGSILYDMRQLTSTKDGKYILSYQRSLRPSRFYVFDPMELR